MKTDLIYSGEELIVNLEGTILKNDYKKLKSKLNYIVNQYDIKGIIVNTLNSDIDNIFLNDLITSFSHIKII